MKLKIIKSKKYLYKILINKKNFKIKVIIILLWRKIVNKKKFLIISIIKYNKMMNKKINLII